MKNRKSLIAVGVAIALVASATANAAAGKAATRPSTTSARSNPLLGTAHGPAATTVWNRNATLLRQKSSPPSTSAGVESAAAPRRVVYIDVTGGAPVVESQAQLCETDGEGCTLEQYCTFWSFNCASIGGDGSANDSSIAPASANGLTSDGSTVADPADLLADDANLLSELEQEYCCQAGACEGLALT